MYGSINLAYRKYLKDYYSFSSRPREKIKTYNVIDRDYISSILKVKKYSSNQNFRRNFLVIPSVFNSCDILHIAKKRNFIEILLTYGDVYMVNWLQSENDLSINDYVLEVTKLLKTVARNFGSIDVVGHCFGGNIAVGVSSLRPDLISSLTLLTAPWDYSHFNRAVIWYKLLSLDEAIKNLKVVPKIYLQMMFFLMFPDQFLKKINNYYKLKSDEEKLIYMRVEDWLQSGIDLPVSLYRQFINPVISENIFYNNRWTIKKERINPSNITAPVCIIAATNDQIAPASSILPLLRLLKNSTLIKLKGGHISYLINSDRDFIKKYNYWLKQI